MRIYLDNCSYNRPYDDQSQICIYLETQAKLHIQDMIRKGDLELVTSYVLDYENDRNRSLQKKMAIERRNIQAYMLVTEEEMRSKSVPVKLW